MPAFNDNPNGRGYWVNISADTLGQAHKTRRTRGARIAYAKHAYERDHDVTLTKVTTSYDEAFDFGHRTTIRYRINLV